MTASPSSENELLSLHGRSAIVTGGGRGIGRAIAIELARAGANLIITYRANSSSAEAATHELRAFGVGCQAVQADVREAADLARIVKECQQVFGSVDILVNNAGVSVDDRPAAAHTDGDWDFVVGTDLKGPWLCCREAHRYMAAQPGGGAIVNVASVLGLRVMKWIPEYCAAKAGLIHLTKQLALEWASKKVRVNALAPGFYLTDINRQLFEADPATGKVPRGGQNLIRRVPMKRLGALGDLDGPLLLLCSAKAGAFVTGVTIPVDGGHLQSSL